MRRFASLALALLVAVGLVPIGGAASAGTVDTGKIAWSDTPEGDDFPSAHTADPDGTDRASVGPAGVVECLRWAPDGTAVLCNDWSSRVQPAVADPDGSSFHDLNPGLPLDLFCSFWSPNGRRILCHSNGDPHQRSRGLYTVTSDDATDRTRVTISPKGTSDDPFGYSPDGSRILFARFTSESRPGVLYSVRRNGGGRVRLSPERVGVIDPFFDRTGAAWSPDGSRVVFAGQTPSEKSALFVVNADGTDAHRISRLRLGAWSAQWSPDGHLIAFTSYRGAVAVRPNGSDMRILLASTAKVFTRGPIWSPDGHQILAVRNRNGVRSLWAATRNGEHRRKVVDIELPYEWSWGTAPPTP